MSTPNAEKNLLFGILALQMDFISKAQLLAAAAVWIEDKSKQFSQILVEQGALEEPARVLLEQLADRHLQNHNNDPSESLAAALPSGPLADDLRQLGDKDIGDTLAYIPQGPAESQLYSSPSLQRPQPAAPQPRYRVMRQHASGGLGRVSVAMDEELHREVAFKELLERYADDADCRTRFLLEAEITGSLEHPGIVPVYGLGHSGDGRPYYAMRFIAGETFTKAISRFHAGGTSGESRGEQILQLHGLLRRFIDICNAVNYAHSRGVLHRDLKPDNVMLGKYGETLIVDWGLAKAMGRSPDLATPSERTLHPSSASGFTSTRFGSVLGTPAFMGPEQAAGRLDQLGPSSDVYSLGTILYYLLTNQKPFETESVTECLVKIQRGDFPHPREVKHGVPAGLAAICLKAMSLKPPDRYLNAVALAEDIEHWMADEPVSAHRERFIERIGRWTRRHRAWTQSGAAALVLVAAVSVIATMIVNRWRQQAETLAVNNKILAENERQARQESVLRFQEARRTVDTWFTGASEVLKYYPGVQEARKWLLREAAQEYELFCEQKSGVTDLELERALAYRRLGDVRRLLGEADGAEEAYRSAVSLLQSLEQASPGDLETCVELANSHTKLGII